ncbi:MAG: polysaccharide pyruvyl transferase family protein [Cyanobacteria bacterium RUI128]|nr:polysaccharide pyruvyl transferase family protein [Cyanobacteria bacterium RUI128]
MNLKVIFINNMFKWYHIDVMKNQHNNYNIEDFLYLIKNASFVVTDSFHGTCFSLIFEKHFRSIINTERGTARYKIFFDMGLDKHLLKNYDELSNVDPELTVDYTKVHALLEQKRKDAINFLTSALNNPIKAPDKSDLLFDYLQSERVKQKPVEKKELKRLKRKYYKYKFIKTFSFGILKIKYTEKYRRLLNRLESHNIRFKI